MSQGKDIHYQIFINNTNKKAGIKPAKCVWCSVFIKLTVHFECSFNVFIYCCFD